MYFSVTQQMSYVIENVKAMGALSKEEVIAEIQAGFVAWSQVTPFVFSLITQASKANFKVRIGSLDGRGEIFGKNKLAHWSQTDAEILIDETESWGNLHKQASTFLTADPLGLRALANWIIDSTRVDLQSVMVHEIGHLLGLGHSGVTGSIMQEKLEAGKLIIVNGRPIPKTDVTALANLYPDIFTKYFRDRNIQYWWPRQTDGVFRAVEIGFDQSIWTIGTNGVVYRVINAMRQDPKTKKWASRYPVSNGNVKFKRLAVLNQDAVMAIDTDGHVWQLVSENTREWKTVKAHRETETIDSNDLAFSPNGTLYGVVPQTDGIISWHYSPVNVDFHSPYYGGSKAFIKVIAPKPVSRITVCHHADKEGNEADELWALSPKGEIMRWRVDSPSWEIIQGELTDISVGSDGTVIGISTNKKVWHYNRSYDTDSNKKAWKQLNGTLAAVSVGDSTSLWGIDGRGKLVSSLPETLQDD